MLSMWCVFSFLTRYMRPEGPWQRLAAALSDSSEVSHPIQDRILPLIILSHTGASLSPATLIRQTKER